MFQAGQAGASSYGHVAVVDSYNTSSNAINISEGNYAGLATHSRSVNNATSYQYIHES